MAQGHSNISSRHLSRVDGPHFVVPPTGNETPELKSLQADVERIVSTANTKLEAVQAFLQIARTLTNATDVAYALRQGPAWKAVVVGKGASLFTATDQQELLLHWSSMACQAGQVQLNRLDGARETVATLPIFVDGAAVEAIHAALYVPGGQIEPFIISLQLVATGMSAWYARKAATGNQFEASVSSAVIELLSKCNDATSSHEARCTVVTELQKLIGCDAVAFADRTRRAKRVRITSMSGTGDVDSNSTLVRQLEECASESLVREGTTVWPPLSMQDRHTSLVHQQLVRNHGYESVISTPIECDDSGQGVLIFLGKQATLHQQSTLNIVKAIGPHLARALQLRKEAEAGPLQRTKRLVRGTPEKRKTRRAIFIALLLGGLAMLIPVPHKTSCDCSVEPTLKRYATVPFDGILRESLVKPGDMVSAGQVLAVMEDRELRFEKSESSAARTQTVKQRDVYLTKGDVAEAQIASFKAAELTAKLEWVQYREDHLDIKTAIDGVVIEGDLDDAEGASVRRGQVLFEVAPLDSLELKLSISEEDIAFVDNEMSITARLDGTPGKKFDALLESIKPRASAESGQNVFTADGKLEDMDHTLRPGMSGTAKIIGPNRAIGWIVFHRACRKVVDFIDW